MTTTLAAPAARTTTIHARTSFASMMKAEWISLTSLRGNTIALVIGALLVIAPAAGFALLYGKDVHDAGGDLSQVPWVPSIASLSGQGIMFAIAVAALVGAASIAKEHSTGSLRTVLTAAPRRFTLIAAKATVVAATVFVSAIIVLALAFLAALAVGSIYGLPVGIENAFFDLVLPILGGGVFAAATAVFALGLGALLRSETWAVTLSLVVLYVRPVIVMSLPWSWAHDVYDVLLFNTGSTLAGSIDAFTSGYFRDLIITLAWAGVAFFGGAAVMNRKDA
jgi:ABC-2 type transport system permease protein